MWGPAPVEEAIAVIEAHVAESPGSPTAYGAMRGMARIRTLQGRFTEARELLARAKAGWEELGNRHHLATMRQAEGFIDLLTGDLESAARANIEAYEAMRATGDQAYASTHAVETAEALLGLGDLEEAWRYATIARDTSSADDVMSQAGGRAMQARVLARRRDQDAAEALAREAEAIIGATDYLPVQGDVLWHLAHVLHDGGKTDAALQAIRLARDRYDRKGATFFVERVDRQIAAWEAAG
jgi:tetratricopeptide (TPR) repeat protein